MVGIIYRLFLTAGGNFLFNMDNARDMVDVREMVMLNKFRLIGPTSAIEGFFNGPGWYYLLAIPFILSGGDPYGSIIMEITLWAIGGFFLLKLVAKWNLWLIFPVGALWVAADYIVLTNLYAFNPNPVTLLTPLFIYLLAAYIEESKLFHIVFVWILAGLFFNFEMNFGIFTPLIILTSMIIARKFKLVKSKFFWIGVSLFILTLLPQLFFDLRHQFIMSKSVSNFLSHSQAEFNLPNRIIVIGQSFYNTFLPTLLNHKNLTTIMLLLGAFVAIRFFKLRGKKDLVVTIALVYVIIPFLGYLILPVNVNPWHLGGPMAASIILIAFILKDLMNFRPLGNIVSVSIAFFIVLFGITNLFNFFTNDLGKANLDPSLYKNEIAAIDYVYTKANGQNFKVYTYLPSVYDYPYQYLFWWYGQKKYGYIPFDYAYLPDKPPGYVAAKNKFDGSKENFSGLVFLIKEPDRNHTRAGWEGEFINLKSINKEMVGSIEVEIRKEL